LIENAIPIGTLARSDATPILERFRVAGVRVLFEVSTSWSAIRVEREMSWLELHIP